VAGLFAQEALVLTVAHPNLGMCLGSANGVMFHCGMVATTMNTADRRPQDLARFGVLVVAELVTPATLNEVGLIAAVDVLDPCVTCVWHETRLGYGWWHAGFLLCDRATVCCA
jgi:hypothetical protein